MEDVSLTLYGVICEREIIRTAKKKYMAMPDADAICRNDFNRTLKELLILYYQAKDQGMEKEQRLLGGKIEGKIKGYDFA